MKIVEFSNVRFTFYSDYSFKAEYAPDRKFINKELFITQLNNLKNIKPGIKKHKGKIFIRTSALEIIYNTKYGPFHKKSLQVFYQLKGKTKKWYYGLKDRKNLKGTTLHLFKFPKFVKHKDLTDGVISRNGFFCYYDNSFVFWNKDRDWAAVDHKPGYQICFFIGYGHDYQLGLKEYARIFGRACLPPVWVFGLWYSRYYAYKQQELIDLVKKYRKYSIPIDVMVIDTDWRQHIWRGYDWEKKYFPQPGKLIKEFKQLGIKSVLNDHPGYNESDFLPANDSQASRINQLLARQESFPWRCNWSSKKEVELFCRLLLEPKLKQGIDFWWIDGWGAEGICKNEQFFKKHKKADKMALSVKGYENLNPQMWLNYFYYKLTQKVTKKRGVILSRWGGTGSHRYPLWFSGDTYSTWKTLAYQVYFTYTAGNVLTFYWSHDLGGFLGRKIAKDLFIRWIQFGAFSPIMRTHSDHGLREPWGFDKQTLDVFRKYTRIRYCLIPYFYTCAMIGYKQALPVIRAMYHHDPDDKRAYQFKYQYLLGDFLLVAPVVKKSRGYRQKKIFFPEGEWISLENYFITMGKSIQTINVPLDIIPVFIKKGAIIPIMKESAYIGQHKQDYLKLEIFPDKKSEFIYYEDDGLTDDYQKGKIIQVRVQVLFENNCVRVNLGAMTGSYQKVISKRQLEIILHFIEDLEVKKVVAGNKKLQFSRTKKVFEEIDTVFNSYQVKTSYTGRPLSVIFYAE